VSETERDLWIAVIFQAMRDASMIHELERRHKRRSNSNQKHLYHLERVTCKQLVRRWRGQLSQVLILQRCV